MRVVIDCNIVVEGAVRAEMDCVSVLMRVRDGEAHCLVLDHVGRVEREYRGNAGGSEFFRKWYQEVTVSKRPCWSAGALARRHRRALQNEGFHEPSDHVYVALAEETDRYLVTHDSDFGKGSNPARNNAAALGYMTGTMGLTIHTAAEATRRL
jgi:hypothetical protein